VAVVMVVVLAANVVKAAHRVVMTLPVVVVSVAMRNHR
jgi:ATP-dependent RNA helicase DeaD